MDRTLHLICGGNKGTPWPTLIPAVSEDSWGNLCSGLRPFDSAFSLLKVFSTVHLSYSLCLMPALACIFFLDIIPILSLLKVLIWGLWSHSHHLQLNFRNFCSQKPLAILPLGCTLLDWEEDPDWLSPCFKVYSFSLRRCSPYPPKSLFFVCENSFAPSV